MKKILFKIGFLKEVPFKVYAEDILSRFWGVAWTEDYAYVRIFAPIPFNIIINFMINFYWRIACFGNNSYPETRYTIGYNTGYDKGFEDGKNYWMTEAARNSSGILDFKDNIRKQMDKIIEERKLTPEEFNQEYPRTEEECFSKENLEKGKEKLDKISFKPIFIRPVHEQNNEYTDPETGQLRKKGICDLE